MVCVYVCVCVFIVVGAGGIQCIRYSIPMKMTLIFEQALICKLSLASICVGCLSPKWGNFSHQLAKLVVRERAKRKLDNQS